MGVGDVPKETGCALKTEGGTKSEPRQAVVSRSRKRQEWSLPRSLPKEHSKSTLGFRPPEL